MESQEHNITPLESLNLELPPSCIEFCPAHPEYFIVGTYNLQPENASEVKLEEANEQQPTLKKPQNRNGSLVVFQLLDKSGICHVQTVSCPSALLDIHFHPDPAKQNVAAVVSSTGALSFFRLDPSSSASEPLGEISTHKPLGDTDDVLFLSCAWHPTLYDLLAVTTSDHHVHVLRVDDDWNVHETTPQPIITHSLEAWTVAFSPFSASIPAEEGACVFPRSQTATLFSGGDDSKLLLSTLTCHPAQNGGGGRVIEAISSPSTVKGHEAGVTAILPLELILPDSSMIVITGSYDDQVRVYDIPAPVAGIIPRRPKVIGQKNLGGGVWRLKLIHLSKENDDGCLEATKWTALVLASCMHAGSHILEISGNRNVDCLIRILGRMDGHKSMNYGSDFQPGSELGERNLRCISTSFYDKLLCFWEV
ncbi:hypothetical protein F5Y15DRAFT_387508 [Xylariaceae sp. FL0016]|nr:hypothetical protein F5Y15DRAFT_387508 [Xylariaceae sp. FL0016]